MKKNLIDFEPLFMDEIKVIAIKNGRKLTNQSYIELAVEIVNGVIRHLDSDDFENVTNLKK
jgi:hypothetical protein